VFGAARAAPNHLLMPAADAREQRRRSFEQTADLYERYRPSYPEAIFDAVRAYADLAPDDAILEVGAGTGRATVHLARWGKPMIVIEPAPAMADIARANVAEHAHIEVRTSTFEGARLERYAFGLVAIARAFDWLDPATRVERIHDGLYAHGSVALIDNFQVLTDETRPFFERVQDVYLAHAPEIAHQGEFPSARDLPAHQFEGSPLFGELQRPEHPWEWTLSAEDYVGLMSTHSPHATLHPDVRARLLAGIAELIDDEFGGSVTEHYIAVAALARRA
jgi:SAM-dependent methyltransferase